MCVLSSSVITTVSLTVESEMNQVGLKSIASAALACNSMTSPAILVTGHVNNDIPLQLTTTIEHRENKSLN